MSLEWNLTSLVYSMFSVKKAARNTSLLETKASPAQTVVTCESGTESQGGEAGVTQMVV